MKTIKILCLSDLHGTLPPSKNLPKCDLVLIGGDITKGHGPLDQSIWLHKEFKPWLTNLQTSKIVGVAGNHDFIWEKAPHLVPSLPWTYLQDSGTEFKGWKIYGTPWQPRFYDWAFNMDEPDLKKRWELIPDDTDILVLHGPPEGFGDWVARDRTNTGSPSLTKRIKEIKPKLVIYGHIHPGYGVYELPGITMANVSILDDRYKWVNDPVEVTLDVENRKTIAVANKEEYVIHWGDQTVPSGPPGTKNDYSPLST